MGTVGTWVFPVIWSLCCAFVAATGWQSFEGDQLWLVRRKNNELCVCYAVIWSLVGWLLWLAIAYWRAGRCA